MALISWLDAMRMLYLTPSRTGSPLTLLYDRFEKREYTPQVRGNLDAGKCTRAISKPLSIDEKNRRERELFGMCVLVKPGPKVTAGNMGPADYGRSTAKPS